MKRRYLYLLCSIFILASCGPNIREDMDPLPYFKNLYGSYKLTGISWLGGYNFDIIDDGDGFRKSMLEHFQDMIGYYEPSYSATVGKEYNNNTESDVSVFNFVIPYPYFIQVEDEWKCSSVHNLQLSIRIPNIFYTKGIEYSDFYLCYQDNDDLFLSCIEKMSIIVRSSTIQDIFELRIYFKNLPHDTLGKEQMMDNNGYISYHYYKPK